MPALPPELADLLAKQHGLATRGQLLECLTEKAIRTAQVRGWLVTCHTGVYRLVGAPRSRQQQILAAVLAGGDGAAAARVTAAELHGIEGPRRRQTVVVLVPHDRRVERKISGIRFVRSRTIDASQLVSVDGIRCTDVPRTLCDLAINYSVDVVHEAAADALRKKRTTLDQLDERFHVAGRIPGKRRLGVALARLSPADEKLRSKAEAVARRLLASSPRIPAAVPAFPVLDPEGRLIAEIDFAWPEPKVGLEIDGYWWHSKPSALAKDRRRQAALAEQGWVILRVAVRDVFLFPESVVASVERTLAAHSTRA